jgi:hypothetical protein
MPIQDALSHLGFDLFKLRLARITGKIDDKSSEVEWRPSFRGLEAETLGVDHRHD